MLEVKVSEHETFEIALKRFHRKVQQEGILAEVRRRAYYEKPGVQRRRAEAARRLKIATHKG